MLDTALLAVIAICLSLLVWRGSTWRAQGVVTTFWRRFISRKYTMERSPRLRSKVLKSDRRLDQ